MKRTEKPRVTFASGTCRKHEDSLKIEEPRVCNMRAGIYIKEWQARRRAQWVDRLLWLSAKSTDLELQVLSAVLQVNCKRRRD